MDKMSVMSIKMNEIDSPAQADRRAQRTQQALLEALLDLLKTRHYDAISVKDIIDRANVGRSTFYAHYQTKDELLKSGFERVLNMLLDQVEFDAGGHHLKINTIPLFRHAQGHAELFRTLSWGSGFDLITMQGMTSLSTKFLQRLTPLLAGSAQATVPLPVLTYSLAGSLLVLVKWWLENGMPVSPEEMDGNFQRLIMPGIRASLEGL
jgi:AcrR family transcriptional regulator